MLGNQFETRRVIITLKEFFGFDKQVRLLRSKLSEKGHIENVFGRPIFVDDDSDHVLFNHFIQSSAAEASILGFHNMFKTMLAHLDDCIPTFVIHDALVVDVGGKSVDAIGDLCKHGIDITSLGNFPVDVKDLSEC